MRAIYRDNRRYVVGRRSCGAPSSAETAATLTTIMEGVVERGTAKAAQIPGYTIAGKTGTAAKLVNGRYSNSDYNASFVGFLPSRDPAVAIIVVIDSPHGGRLHRRRRVGADLQADRGGDAALSRRRPDDQSRAAGARRAQDRPPNAPAPAHGGRTSQWRSAWSHDAPGTIPDLRGMSAREAVRSS